MKKTVAVIPARYKSSRFPGKPIAKICGKPMIQWVYESVCTVNELSDVFVATDDIRIQQVIDNIGGRTIMTENCNCGTERVYQAIKNIDCDIVLNIQGDEPLIKKYAINDLIRAFDDPNVKMATLKKEILKDKDINDPNIAKVITDNNNDAIYFSRSRIPYNRDVSTNVRYYKHIGIYGYTKSFLRQFVAWPPSALEIIEQLEQLRVIQNQHKIRVMETQYDSIGVDLLEHIAIVETIINNCTNNPG